ncbi:pectinesterase inhibitor-like [Lolium rigidum]|uniref:pectinesterase inhibitor-like n=1 Tax=Lolium rigidum TaxID=89674 RepID=UPI001F5E03B1|nr:pectinesterase inhibitor-like [Lolium rigidum]
MARAATMSVAMVLVMLAAVFTAHADVGFISNTCKKTKNPSQCVAVLRADPRSAKASTEHDLASIALQIATDTADHNGEVIEKAAKNSQGTPEGDALLGVCFGAYGKAASDLGIDARPWFDSGDYTGAWKLISGAKDAGDVCENAFKGIGKRSPVTDIDRQMTERCDVACDLVRLLIPK